jgi:hypothetical protein
MADPGRWDINVRRNNAPYVTVLTVTDDAGVAINFTSCTAAMQVRLYQGAPGSPLISLTNVATAIEGIQFTNAAAGEFTIRINLATLEALVDSVGENQPTAFQYDLLIYDTDSVPLLCLYGDFNVATGVTR